MKLTSFLPLLFMLSIKGFGQSQIIKINQNNFEFITLKNDTLSQNMVEIFRDNEKIIEHVLYKDDGDCSSVAVELGNYKINGNQIVFYTYWIAADRQRISFYPFGFRKQVYAVNENGLMKLVKAEIYIEDYIDGEEHKGMDYLQTIPKTKAEKELLENYVKAVELKYNAQFVNGDKRKTLQKEVWKALKSEIRDKTKYWKEIYGENVKI